jgi:predicted DNA-binding transcriptional regulator YafY
VAHRVSRVLSILELLQSHGRMSGAELARRLGVDARTVRRDVVRLEEMGIPLTAEMGRHGGYMLVAGYKLPPLMFSPDEALAVALGLSAARALGVAGVGAAALSAQAKLQRVLPAPLQRRLREVDEAVQLDLAGIGGGGGAGGGPAEASAASLALLAAAARDRRRVHLAYRSARGEESERDFDPYGLARRAGCWYAVGWCHLRRGVRSFRLDRVVSLRALDAVFERPQEFDALAHLAASFAGIPRRHTVEVRLATDLATARRELFTTLGVLEADGDGVLLRGQADDLAWFAQELARLPFPFTILRPPALRSALARHAEALAAAAARTAPSTRSESGSP